MSTDKIKFVIDTLKNEVDSYISWASRKEIAIWAAVLFYFTIVWQILSLINNNYSNSNHLMDIFLILYPSILFVFIISFIFAFFIHSQFSSIYAKEALARSIRNKILDGKIFDLYDKGNFKINKKYNLPDFLINDYENQYELVSSFEDKKYEFFKVKPLKNLIYLWSFRWLIEKLKNPKNNIKLLNHARQESLIYSLIILLNIIFSIFVHRIIFGIIF